MLQVRSSDRRFWHQIQPYLVGVNVAAAESFFDQRQVNAFEAAEIDENVGKLITGAPAITRARTVAPAIRLASQ